MQALDAFIAGVKSPDLSCEVSVLAWRNLDDLDPWVLCSIAAYDLPGAIRRSIVYNDPLQRLKCLMDHRFDRLLNEGFFVMCRRNQDVAQLASLRRRHALKARGNCQFCAHI